MVTLEEMALFPPEVATISRIKNKRAKSDVFYRADLGPRLREPWRDPGFHGETTQSAAIRTIFDGTPEEMAPFRVEIATLLRIRRLERPK